MADRDVDKPVQARRVSSGGSADVRVHVGQSAFLAPLTTPPVWSVNEPKTSPSEASGITGFTASIIMTATGNRPESETIVGNLIVFGARIQTSCTGIRTSRGETCR